MPSIFSSKRTREKISKENVFISYSDTLATIDFSYLELLKIEGVILDIDNTIISEDDQYVSPHAEDWIKQAKELNINLFLLSNGKRKKRVEYWSNRLNIPAISPAKKPCSPAIHAALKYMNLSPEKL